MLRKISLGLAALLFATLPVGAQQQPVNIGAAPNDFSGDTPRLAFSKLNANDADLYARVSNLLTALNNKQPINANLSALSVGTITGVGTVANTLAAGNDSRLVGAVQQSGFSAAHDTAFSSIRGAVLYRGTSGWTALAPGSAGSVLATGGPGADVSWVTAGVSSAALDSAFGSTQGSILYRSTSAWTTLTPGTAGNVLQTGGTGANPSWAAPSSGAYLPAPSTPSSNTTLVSGDAERPILATGSPTITMANGGAGWKTGPIRNANTLTGLVTLAVPSGATLDGTANGTVVLYPYQRARIIQTGTTAYVTDWIDRSPIIANVAQVGVASADFVLPAGYGSFEVLIRAAEPGTSGASMAARLSDDGGSTFKAGTADYGYEIFAAQSTSMSSNAPTASSFPVIGAVQTGNGGGKARLEIDGNPSGLFPRLTSRSGATVGGSYQSQTVEGFCASISTNRVSAVRLLWSSGTGPINATVRAIP